MENASKALIIAGAILLAISIIGLGIFIFRQASNTVSDTGMDQLAIQQFNAQFENYIKTNVSANTVKSLLDTVSTNNDTSDTKVKVKWKTHMPEGVTEDSEVTKTQIVSANKYDLTDNSATNGAITEIYVSLVSSTSEE